MLPSMTFAKVEVPSIFGDNMILQRELLVPIWGTASPGEKVLVSFDNQTVETTADKQGKWMVKLKPLKTSRTERKLTIKGSNTITFEGVLVGEVWLCSGQSNMADSFNPQKKRRIEPEYFKMDLSRFRVSSRNGWNKITPTTQRFVSRVSFYFGIELYKELNIPIGLILRYNSGTPIQAWMPENACEVIRKKLKIPPDWKDAHGIRNPAVQFDDKIAPIVPFAFRGAIWYQGERNAKAQTGWEYRDLLPFHIKTWRELWATSAGTKLRNFPFYYVQVPTQESPVDAEWPWLRDAMRRALGTTENTGMAVFYDHGPSLHPENKQPAGERLALWALAKDYGRKDLVYSGPLLDKVTIDKDRAVLSFEHIGSGLKNKSGEKNLKFFEIAGKDGKYVKADAWIQADAVIVQNKNITKPAYVRYLFRKPEPNTEISLINAEGLPASSFMTDDFMPPREMHAPEREADGRARDVIESDIVPAFVDTASADTQPTGLIAEGHDSRIDLVWDRVSDTDQDLFNIYRAEQADGPWKKLNVHPHTVHVYSDFIGKNGRTYHYRVTQWIDNETDFSRYRAKRRTRGNQQLRGTESAPSESASATTHEMNDEKFLDSMQKACFRYFWDFGHPVSGLAREGFLHRRSTTTTGGTGFGMVTIMVGADRGFVTREQAAERLLKMVTFLEEKAERYHGLWSHHLRGDKTIPFAGREDNGGDIVESAFLMEGMLTIREYFGRDNPVENELRERITRLWKEAQWSWYLQPGDKMLTWHWSKNYGFVKNHKFRGFNECMIAYLLAMASPTHSIPADCYYLGWAGNVDRYVNSRTYYDIKQPVGNPLGGPLFFTHYSYIGLDPHQLTDAYTNYYDNNRAISLIQHSYAIDNPNNHQGYGKLVWGLTASQNPRGYKAHQPGANSNRDDGTIAPTAAISAFPYTPDESTATLKHFYYEMGSRIWGPFGFRDAFNLGADWVSPSYLA
jgi:hypothetical protein